MTKVFEIKIGKNWKKVRANSMTALNSWGKENNVSDWRMCGMRSRSEMEEDSKLEIVA